MPSLTTCQRCGHNWQTVSPNATAADVAISTCGICLPLSDVAAAGLKAVAPVLSTAVNGA